MRLPPLKVLGIIGVVGAPWVLIDFINNGLYDRFVLTSASGIRSFFFMTGWICCVLGLYKLHEPMSNARRFPFWVLLFFLLLADIWNVMEVIDPHSQSGLFFLLNFSWPLGGLFMIVTSIVIIRAKRLKGWKKYMPLLASLWFPQTMFMAWAGVDGFQALIISGLYAAISFGLLGFSLIAASNERMEQRVFA
ncbi:MAG: hypothetical protein ACXVBX_11405 [Flavisolibacter sp.]